MKEINRLTRWMSVSDQPEYLNLDHEAQKDIAWAADKIKSLHDKLNEINEATNTDSIKILLIKPNKDSVLTNLIDAWQTREYKHPVQKIAALQCLIHELWEIAESGDYPDELDTFEFWRNLNESSR